MIKVLTADAHPVVSVGLKQFFLEDAQIQIVQQIDNLIDLVPYLEKHKIDLVVMDTDFRGADGMPQVRYMRKHLPDVKIILFTNDTSPANIRRANYAGVQGYLYKHASPETLRKTIRDVANGIKVRDADIVPEVISVPKVPTQPNTGKEPKRLFSPREMQVLEFLAKGLTNHEVSKELGVTQSTVETFRARIMAKSKRKNVAELIKWAIEMELLK